MHALAFNHCAPGLGNLFATVGGEQATVYDDEHMADHVAVVVQLANAPSQHAPGGQLQVAAWLAADGWAEQPAGEACLAVAGQDPNISGELGWGAWVGGGGESEGGWEEQCSGVVLPLHLPHTPLHPAAARAQ